MVNKGVITLAMKVNTGVIAPFSFGKETSLEQLPDHE